MKKLLLVPGLFALAACLGCSSAAAPETAVVRGKVVLGSQPVTSGSVLFVGENGGSNARINSDGTYVMENAPLGAVNICVMNDGEDVTQNLATDTNAPAAPTPTQSGPIPPRYETPDNGLTFTVKKGSQEFDITLTP